MAEHHDETPAYTPGDERKFRSLVFHLLYAMEAYDYDVSLGLIIDNFNRGYDLDLALDGDEATVAQAVINQRDELDQRMIPFFANWRIERVGVCTKLILRYALWELEHTKTDPKIIINEAIELAKCFAEPDAYKFVNGVLDQALKAE